MVRFYFHTENGRRRPDDEGCELADLSTAKREAVRVLGEILRDGQEFWETEELRLVVSSTADAADAVFVVEVRSRPRRAVDRPI